MTMADELLLSAALCAGMLISSYMPYRVSKLRPAGDREESYRVMVAAVLAVQGLLLGFTMQTAMDWFLSAS